MQKKSLETQKTSARLLLHMNTPRDLVMLTVVLIDEKFQTLTYYGLDKELILKFIYTNRIKGIDRIMPVGLAHEMSFFWDGYDLEEHMTRTIDAK